MCASVFREKGYRFYFLSNEEERMHVHVSSDAGEAKFWLEPICVVGSISWVEPEKTE